MNFFNQWFGDAKRDTIIKAVVISNYEISFWGLVDNIVGESGLIREDFQNWDPKVDLLCFRQSRIGRENIQSEIESIARKNWGKSILNEEKYLATIFHFNFSGIEGVVGFYRNRKYITPRELKLTEAKKQPPTKPQYSYSKCPECGGDEMSPEMAKERGYEVTFNGVFARFSCHRCAALQKVNVDQIDLDKGISVLCPSCRAISFIPPSVWCKTCHNVLVPDWQNKIVDGRR